MSRKHKDFDLNFTAPLFIGPNAENDQVFENLFLQFYRDHIYWRRNFHPKDKRIIPTSAPLDKTHQEFVTKLDQELHELCADLKQSVPLFSPRYLGHMASDVLISGLLAQMITTLYNPNNVCEETSPITTNQELEVGKQIAGMFGMDSKRSWGVLTSGGTIANYTAIRNFIALKFYPLALKTACQKMKFNPDISSLDFNRPFLKSSNWDLVNYPIKSIIQLKRSILNGISRIKDVKYKHAFMQCLHQERIETCGMTSYLNQHRLDTPLILAPVSVHYSWEKAMKLTGLGSRNLVAIGVDDQMRLDPQHLRETLQSCIKNKKSILACIGVLGTTEYGAIDPVHRIIQLRKEFSGRGLDFAVHIDAAWGGYLASLFRDRHGDFLSRGRMKQCFKYFPSQHVHSAFRSLSQIDSATVDPHKLGYIPYPAGAYINSNKGVISFITQNAPYVFQDDRNTSDEELRHNLGQYVLEGSKPGSMAAAVYITHRVLPPNNEGFGKLMRHTILSSEYFYDQILALAKTLKSKCTLILPFHPDTNIICLCLNPTSNTRLAVTNRFMSRLISAIQGNPIEPIQNKEYFVSHTHIEKSKLNLNQSTRILKDLGLNIGDFTNVILNPETESDHIVVLRHTLMNPWLMHHDENNETAIDKYILFLKTTVLHLLENF